MALKVSIKRMYPYEGEGNIKAFFDVKCSMGGRVFGFNDLKLIKSENTGLFVGHPSKAGSQEGEFFDYSYTDGKSKQDIQRAAIAAYNKKIKEKTSATAQAS